MTTVDQLIGLHAQMNEVFKRVGNGSLDPTAVKRALQDIIEGKLPLMQNWNPPTWWRPPEQQLERARQLWPNAVLPEPPAVFTPRTKFEVLLLHVPDTFDSLWNKVIAPDGYTKYRWEGALSDKQNLRLAPNKVEYMEPVWLAFDPEHGRGVRPNSFWGRADIAASEVFSALIQFPDWPLGWLDSASVPNLSGYRLGKYDGKLVPCVEHWDRQLRIYANWDHSTSVHWSSPSVRVLN